MTEQGNFPLQVKILTPSYIPRARGIHATARMGSVIKLRVSEDDRSAIEKAAALCGVNMSTFLRWCGVHAADSIVRAMEKKNDGDDNKRP